VAAFLQLRFLILVPSNVFLKRNMKTNTTMPIRQASIFAIIILFESFKIIQAAPIVDTTNKPLLAFIDHPLSTKYITKSSNVIYPDVLMGNEAESKDYVEKFSVNRRDYLIRTFNKGKKVFPKVVKILKKYNLPQEYKVLIALESGFNGNAVSGAGAVGYWQIMDFVAKEYHMNYVPQLSAEEKLKLALLQKETDQKKEKKVVLKDDRKNFIKSTHVAAKYLKERQKNLNNDMLLVVASYNCGVGNVWKAIKKTGNPNANFWDVVNFLPAETQAYVKKFITLNVVFNNYNNFSADKLNFNSVKIKITEETNSPEMDIKNTIGLNNK
jgi:Transglycosylase SLT domain